MRMNGMMRTGLVGVLTLCAGLAAANPPTDAEIDGFIKKVNEAGRGKPERGAQARAMVEAAKSQITHVSLGEASLGQLEKVLEDRIGGIPAVRDVVRPRLKELGKAPDADGARATELFLTMLQPKFKPGSRELTEESTAELADTLLATFNHPGYPALLKAGKGEGGFRMLGNLPPSAMASRHVLEAAEPHMQEGLSAAGVYSLGAVLRGMLAGREAPTGIPAELRERVRAKIEAATASAVEKSKGAEGAAAQHLKGLQDQLTLVRGAWARGTLLGNPAPAIEFGWVSGEGQQHSFADFKGKVVLVDFWATWYGPCRSAFPNVHQIAERYKGYDVVILGVTSLQGYHVDGASKRIDCKDDPKKEYGLMAELMKELSMDWTVAFSDKSCLNPDFGVQAMPHLAIIDAKGVVRHNGVSASPAEQAEKIDALLKEAGLKAPEKPIQTAAPKPIMIKPQGGAPAPAPGGTPLVVPPK